MMLSTYVAEQMVAAKYAGKVEQIRGWYNRPPYVPINDAAEFVGITVSQFANEKCEIIIKILS